MEKDELFLADAYGKVNAIMSDKELDLLLVDNGLFSLTIIIGCGVISKEESFALFLPLFNKRIRIVADLLNFDQSIIDAEGEEAVEFAKSIDEGIYSLKTFMKECEAKQIADALPQN